jgi:hypothetical protein
MKNTSTLMPLTCAAAIAPDRNERVATQRPAYEEDPNGWTVTECNRHRRQVGNNDDFQRSWQCPTYRCCGRPSLEEQFLPWAWI